MSQASHAVAAAVPAQHTLTEQLNTNFAQGWRKLPNEFKIKILAYNLVSDIPIGHEPYLEGSKDYDHVLTHHMELGTEIALLAKQVYYGKNTFILCSIAGKADEFNLPPEPVRKYIRRIITPSLSPIFSAHMHVFKQLASGAYGLKGLVHITVRVQLYDVINDLENSPHFPHTSVQFHCQGVVEFTVHHDSPFADDQYEENKRCFRRLFNFAK